MDEPVPRTMLSDDEIRHRMLADPETRSRVEDLLRRIREGTAPREGIPAHELADFLREHGLEPRTERTG